MQLRKSQIRTLTALVHMPTTGVGTLRELADALEVEPTTVRNSIMRLAEKGLVSYRTKGKGREGQVRLLATGRSELTRRASSSKTKRGG